MFYNAASFKVYALINYEVCNAKVRGAGPAVVALENITTKSNKASSGYNWL